MTNTLHVQVTLTHTPEAIFDALTDKNALEVWFSESAEIDLSQNQYAFWGKYTPGIPAQADGQHAILKYEPNQQLVYEWQLGEVKTSVAMTAHSEGDQTTLVVEHTADESDEGPPISEDFWFLSLDNLGRFLDGKSVALSDFSANQLGDVTQTIEIAGDPAAIFDIIVNPEQMGRWIASDAKVDLRVGGVYDYGWGAGGPVEILTLEPNKEISISGEGWGPFPPTVMTWTLEESGGKTRLTVVQSGFADDADNSGLTIGWLHFLVRIQSLVEYGSDWKHAIKKLPEEHLPYYSKAHGQRQSEIIER